MTEIVEKLEHGIMVCSATGTMLVHIDKEDAEKIVALLKKQEGTINELQNAYGYLQKQFFEVQDELLKEQEAVPVVQREIAHLLFWCCSSCGTAITDGDKFCRMCGRRMKWNGQLEDGE